MCVLTTFFLLKGRRIDIPSFLQIQQKFHDRPKMPKNAFGTVIMLKFHLIFF